MENQKPVIWTPVTETLPPDMSRVLVCVLDVALLCYATAFYSNKKFLLDVMTLPIEIVEKYSDKTIKNVTHWALIEQPNFGN